ncbi:MAG: helix-turn-helix transcriptional regulator [Elusimicrobiota bacterium]|jgi:transcriptional regulator with XRE-family HTH domain
MSGVYDGIGRRVRGERHRRGWTQEELGERAGMHPSYIGQIERGTKKISLAALQRLAKALAVRMGALLDDPLPNPSADDDWSSKVGGLLRDRTPSERGLLYSTLKHLSRQMRRKR